MSDVKTNLLGFQLFSEISQLGLSGDATLEETATSMPYKSIGFFAVDGKNDYGELKLSPVASKAAVLAIRLSNTANMCIFIGICGSSSLSDIYIARYSSSAGTKTVGWKKLQYGQ